jgi:hypothetical protein
MCNIMKAQLVLATKPEQQAIKYSLALLCNFPQGKTDENEINTTLWFNFSKSIIKL